MKIALTGAHGTGKTTILNALKERLPHYHIDPIGVTKKAVQGDSKKLNFGTTIHTQKAVGEATFDMIKNAPDNSIFPRCLIDVLAYTIYFYGHNPKSEITREFTKNQYGILLDNIEYLDVVFYIPIEFEQQEGGKYREGQLEHPNYQYEIDIIIRTILSFLPVPVVIINGELNERVNKIVQYITKERK